MRVLLIDPWGIHNTAEYLNGLIYGLSGAVSLDVFTNYYFVQHRETSVTVHRLFFQWSEKMKDGKLRKLIRGAEYVLSYVAILRHLRKVKYDVVHINWLLFYRMDILFLQKIKKYVGKLVYTAHNVLPHVNGNAYKAQLDAIYHTVDNIIVHGETVKQEMLSYFPDLQGKIYVQKHGCVLSPVPAIQKDALPQEHKSKLESYHKIFISCGVVFPNKGMDRLCRIWMDHYQNQDALLIVGGKQTAEDPVWETMKPEIHRVHNMILLDGFIADAALNAYLNAASAIVLPYRHASMSGVVFTAAQFAKPIICTDVGSLPEYLEDRVDSFCCANDDVTLKETMDLAMELPLEELRKMGGLLRMHIAEKCDWVRICAGVIRNVYGGAFTDGKDEW